VLDLDAVMNWSFPPLEHTITFKDCALYALSLGYGRDPLDADGLRFVYEDDMKVVPSMAAVIAYPSGWSSDPATGIDWTKIVHGQQSSTFHRTVPTTATIVGRMSVLGVEDKGRGKGALVYTENRLSLKDTGEPVATIWRSAFCRGDGGCGSAGEKGSAEEPTPQRAADAELDIPTEAWQALLYRLNGDFNPLHASPQSARKAGFDRPILHGLCTYGIACRAILAACCANLPERLGSLRARFTAPVYPGETLRTLVWVEGEAVRFECRSIERDKVVLGAGAATAARAGSAARSLTIAPAQP
jgi:acyl dehydratase